MMEYYIYKHKNGIGFTKVSKDHLDMLLNLKTESWRTTHRISFLSMETQQKWYDSLMTEDIHCPKNLILIATCEVDVHQDDVGVFKLLNIDWYNRKADAAWDIFARFRGKKLGSRLVEAGVGFAKEALNLRKLNAEILENNPASLKCAERAGFVEEGVKREEVFRDGKYLDSLMLGCFISQER